MLMCYALLYLITIGDELTTTLANVQAFILFSLINPIGIWIGHVSPVKKIIDRMMNLGPPRDRNRSRYTKLTRHRQGTTKAIYCRRKGGSKVIRKWRGKEFRKAMKIKEVVIAQCMTSTTTKASTDWLNASVASVTNDHSYDTDSYLIGIDNHASSSLTNDENDFVKGTVKQTKVRVKGIKGKLLAAKVGTARWKIEDDDGKIHVILLPNTY